MNGKTVLRWGMLLVLLAVFACGLIISLVPSGMYEGLTCMGIPVMSETELERLGKYQYRDYSENLKFRNEYVAVDQERSVIYIPQSIAQDTVAADLGGTLTIDIPGKKLYFAPDGYWDDLSGAVRKGHPFKLLVTGSMENYMVYDVIFTTLPVISMHGQLLYKDSEYREVLSGRIVLWDPETSETMAGGVHWHIRGKSASGQDKKPWKLSLKNREGKNRNESFLGLGSDDDWILNAMNMEDSNVREKLFMDLWNEVAEESGHNYAMSRGEYAEVLVNGEYSGLYLLQRRVDEKYLHLSTADVLLKAYYENGDISCEYSTAYKGDETQKNLIDGYFWEEDMSCLSTDNFVDVTLFLQLFCAKDNLSYKNMYYLFSGPENGYEVCLIPWDTDAALGVGWNPETEQFIYDYENGLNAAINRWEWQSMEQMHPDLNDRLRSRWQELRQSIFTKEHLWEKLDEYYAKLDQSGAPARDQERWGLFFEGNDTAEKAYCFLEERLAILDDYYS